MAAFFTLCRWRAPHRLAGLLAAALLAGALASRPAHAVDLWQAYQLARGHDARLRAASSAESPPSWLSDMIFPRARAEEYVMAGALSSCARTHKPVESRMPVSLGRFARLT